MLTYLVTRVSVAERWDDPVEEPRLIPSDAKTQNDNHRVSCERRAHLIIEVSIASKAGREFLDTRYFRLSRMPNRLGSFVRDLDAHILRSHRDGHCHGEGVVRRDECWLGV